MISSSSSNRSRMSFVASISSFKKIILPLHQPMAQNNIRFQSEINVHCSADFHELRDTLQVLCVLSFYNLNPESIRLYNTSTNLIINSVIHNGNSEKSKEHI